MCTYGGARSYQRHHSARNSAPDLDMVVSHSDSVREHLCAWDPHTLHVVGDV